MTFMRKIAKRALEQISRKYDTVANVLPVFSPGLRVQDDVGDACAGFFYQKGIAEKYTRHPNMPVHISVFDARYISPHLDTWNLQYLRRHLESAR
jgi:hypothetical protein